MTAFTAGIIIVTAAAAAWMAALAVRELGRAAWGRQFALDTDSYIRGGVWLPAASTTEALSLELIRRSDKMTATRLA